MNLKPYKPQGGCVFGCLSLLTPRIVIVLLVLVSDYLGEAYATVLWPLLGFLFMPITTLAVALARHELQAQPVFFWAVIGLGVALDLGLLGGGSWGFRRPRG